MQLPYWCCLYQTSPVRIAGTVLYLSTEGFCWARATALMAEIVGQGTHDASTLFSVLNAVSTIPILYMIRLDGLGFSKFGTHGLLWVDAGANILVFAVVVTVFVACGMGLRRPLTAVVSSQSPAS